MFWIYGDNVVKRGFPVVGILIIALNVLIYLYQVGLWREDMAKAPRDIELVEVYQPDQYFEWYKKTRFHSFIERWGSSSTKIRNGDLPCIITANFVHGDLMHLVGNMLVLWAFLGTLEISLGPLRFLGCYLFWCVVCSLADLVFDPTGTIPGIGASGAIAGMLGAYMIAFGALTKIRAVFFWVFFFRLQIIKLNIPAGAYVFVWVLLQIVGMEAESQYGESGVGWGAHIGGFVAGVATMLVFRRGVLRKMVRNDQGELQVLDDEEREEYDKKMAAKAERKAAAEGPIVRPRSCPRCNYTVGPIAEKCPMCFEPVPFEEAKPEESAEEELPAEEEVPEPQGIRPWHIILGISAVLLLAAAFIATRKEKPDPVAKKTSAEKEEKSAAEFKLAGKPLADWVNDLKGDDLAKRRETATKLNGVSDPDGAKQLAALLAPALKDDDLDVRQLSAYVLSNIKVDPEQADVIAALAGAIRDKKSRKVREYASGALLKVGQSKPEKIAEVVAAALADEDTHVRKVGVYLHENVDPDGTKLAPFGVRLDLITARQAYGPTKRLENFSNFKASGQAPKPPAEVFQTVRYPSSAGEMVAYITPDPGDGVKRPAVLWAHGGFSGIGSYLWLVRSRANDQTASAFRAAGCVLMCPAWRNENDNPGLFTLFYDELDDLLLAREYLAGLPYVDPERIYLAGHDSGGTLALLAAPSSDGFRAIFSFGGAPDMNKYIQSGAYGDPPFNGNAVMELRLRSAKLFASAIRKPTFYFGSEDNSFGQDALVMQERAKKAKVPFEAFIIKDGTHYDILDPITRLIARKILADKEETCNITFTADEVQKAFAKRKK
jgi:membrane associated rhomboid family serine protease/dienelactone hydrolase